MWLSACAQHWWTTPTAGVLAEQVYVGPNAYQIGITDQAFAACTNCVNVREDPSCTSVKNGTKYDQFEKFRGGLAGLLGDVSTATTGTTRTCKYVGVAGLWRKQQVLEGNAFASGLIQIALGTHD